MRRSPTEWIRSIDAAARRSRPLLTLALAAFVVLPPPAASQVLYGSITGNVSDQTGAALAGAKVAVTNSETGVVKTTTTDERGAYLLTDLQPGLYAVTMEAAGFRLLSQKGVRLSSNAVLRVDARLELSAVTETTEVTAATAALQTDRADIHITQSSRQVTELPRTGSAGRNYQSIMTLVPGDVILTGTPSGVGPLQSGDVVEVEIQAIGVLSNAVA